VNRPDMTGWKPVGPALGAGFFQPGEGRRHDSSGQLYRGVTRGFELNRCRLPASLANWTWPRAPTAPF